MSFFGKFKGGSASAQTSTASPSKKDAAAQPMSALERHLRNASEPVRSDGSDKFFGFENYGSTCYANSIIQCLYYSAPFRSHVLNFPPAGYLETVSQTAENGHPLAPRSTSQNPYPNVNSPARKDPVTATSPVGAVSTTTARPEESKDSPEYKKRMAIKAGPVLDMIHDRSNAYGMEESLFTALKDIFDSIKSHGSRMGVVSPHKFLDILRRDNEMFRSAMHQDAHEFLNLLLNQVVDSVELFSRQHPALNGAAGANGGTPETELVANAAKRASANGLDTRWVHDLFEGLLTSETRCLTCETTSQRDEPFLDLSVDLAAHSSVTSCLRKFSEEEMLCERNKFHCDNCGGLQEAEKRMKIKRLPRVLALHLKRFKYTEDLQRLQKLFHHVVYPFHLRLFNTTDDAEDADRLYELYAVVVHIGGGPYHGHYVSIVKTQDRGWLLFDDELVEPVDKSYVQSFFGGEPVPGLQDARQLACAYVLFYQETTIEAMLREQELESFGYASASATDTAAAAAAARLSDVDTANDPLSPVSGGGTGVPWALHQTHTVTLPANGTPLYADSSTADPQMNTLAHAATAPMEMSSPGAEHESTSGDPKPIERSKTRRELKAQEKERKAAAKAEAKALEERRREASTKRIEAWRKAQDDMAAAIEASKLTAISEAETRGGDANAHKPAEPREIRESDASSAGKENGSSGGGALSRFRTGSISRRASKPKWMGGGGSSGATASGTADAPSRLSPSRDDATGGADAADAPLLSSSPADDRSKRSRFSLGRKRSQVV